MFFNEKTMLQIARQQGISLGRVRQIKEKGLWRLRIGKAKRELLERFDIAEAGLYRGGIIIYKGHNFTYIVEHTVIKELDAREMYERHLKEVEERYRKRVNAVRH